MGNAMQIAILAEKLSELFAMPIGTMQVSPVRLWSLKQQDVCSASSFLGLFKMVHLPFQAKEVICEFV